MFFLVWITANKWPLIHIQNTCYVYYLDYFYYSMFASQNYKLQRLFSTYSTITSKSLQNRTLQPKNIMEAFLYQAEASKL